MRKFFILVLAILPALIAKAQYPGFSPIADANKFKTDFAAATARTTTIKSDFVQEKNLAMLSEKITSKGKFWFKKDNRVRMEYSSPYKYLMILNKDKVYVKDGQKENRISTRSNKIFQQINQIMIDCMQGTALNNNDFKTRLFDNKAAALIELSPLTKGMKEMFRNIIVVIDKKDFSVMSIEMQELSGDNTVIHFTNKELNAAIEDGIFTIQ